jgi:hypothetical protein
MSAADRATARDSVRSDIESRAELSDDELALIYYTCATCLRHVARCECDRG